MPITLRIVGIFYNRCDIPDRGEQKVKDVLDYAVENPGAEKLPASNFKYITGVTEPGPLGPKPSVTAFFSKYDSEVTSPTSQLPYAAGEYFLSESLVGNPTYEVWQFYVFGADGVPILPVPPASRIVSFVDFDVPDGGRVVWRLVKILAAPNRVPTVYRKAFGLSAPAQAMV